MMITLFHGTTQEIQHPLAHVGRADLDFGQGFYLTSIRSQAERWAQRVQLLRSADDARLNVYRFDKDYVFSNNHYRTLVFEHYNQEWLEFIVASRRGEEPWRNYDVIEGGVANDKVIDTVEDYFSGYITLEQALGALTYTKINHQICLLNQELIDHHLTFCESILL